MKHAAGLRTITYGSDPSAAFTGKIIESEDPFLTVEVSFQSCSLSLESRLFGSYNFENVLAAACIGYHFNIPPDKIKTAVEQYIPLNNRSQVVNSGKNTLILDAYNANPDSMKNAILNFASSSFPEKAMMIGDMLELGKESDEEHTSILQLVDKTGIKEVYLVGPVFTRLNTIRDWICFQDSDLARLWFEHHPLTGKTILIKASRGIMLEKITGIL
jgi:UDP-N-acetylmuramoyl-tripeptide--D-alanyl-D-alanine ligase